MHNLLGVIPRPSFFVLSTIPKNMKTITGYLPINRVSATPYQCFEVFRWGIHSPAVQIMIIIFSCSVCLPGYLPTYFPNIRKKRLPVYQIHSFLYVKGAYMFINLLVVSIHLAITGSQGWTKLFQLETPRRFFEQPTQS